MQYTQVQCTVLEAQMEKSEDRNLTIAAAYKIADGFPIPFKPCLDFCLCQLGYRLKHDLLNNTSNYEQKDLLKTKYELSFGGGVKEGISTHFKGLLFARIYQ